MKITILGAGIGGLTTALALQLKGIDYEIYESASDIQFAGTGIILANNAMQVFDKFHIRTQLEKLGNPISSLNITNAALEPISKVDLSYFERKYQVKNVAMHRGELQQFLLSKIDKSKLFLGKKLLDISKDTNYNLVFEDGTKVSANIVVGTDGLHSIVRKKMFPNSTTRNANQVCWRGVANFTLPQEFVSELNEAWYDNKRFGIVQISKNQVYWYALLDANAIVGDLENINLLQEFNKFHPLVISLIENTTSSKIHKDVISDLKPLKNWVGDKICLLGDAAHGMTPNLGQGACQAIEDAYVLSACLEKHPVQEAFNLYEKLRIKKAKSIVNLSWQIGKMAHIKNPVLEKSVHFVLKNTPDFINKKRSEQLFKIAKI